MALIIAPRAQIDRILSPTALVQSQNLLEERRTLFEPGRQNFSVTKVRNIVESRLITHRWSLDVSPLIHMQRMPLRIRVPPFRGASFIQNYTVV